jgi:hypothetical protein
MPRSRPIRALEGRRLLRWDARLCISIGSGLCFDAAGPDGDRSRDFVQLFLGVAGVAVQSGACCVNDACVGNFSLVVEGGGRLFHRWPKATATGARPTLRRARHRARSSPRQPRPAEMGVGADFTTSEKGKWGGERERESSGRQASAAQRAIHYKYRRRIWALMGLDVCFQTRYF